ncbi:MAG: hypothetical protein WBL85_08990 [Sedimentisphaerales bacterium]
MEQNKENKITLHLKTVRFKFIITTGLGCIVSYILSIPTIGAIFVVLFIWAILTTLLAILNETGIYNKIKSGFNTDFVLLIICFLIALLFWSKLVFVCDRDNPYKKPLRTATATVEVTVDSNNVRNIYTGLGHAFMFLAKDQNILLVMNAQSCYSNPTDSNKGHYGASAFNPDGEQPLFGKPIYSLAEANNAMIHLSDMVLDSNVIGGSLILILNSSLTIDMPIPMQTTHHNNVYITDIQKYFKKRQ